MAIVQAITASCLICGASFQKNRSLKVYCSFYCYKRAWYLKSRPRPTTSVCRHCKAEFVVPSAKGTRADRFFCSAKCCKAAYYQRDKAKISERAKRRHIKRRVVRIATCPECGQEFKAKRIDSKYCKMACFWSWLKRQPARRTAVRNNNRVREARERGATSVEVIDRETLFTRDGWRCQLCGCATPRHRMGTRDRHAPTTDHIVPLSKGGDHTYLNTQCACLECNVKKGARAIGQLRLC